MRWCRPILLAASMAAGACGAAPPTPPTASAAPDPASVATIAGRVHFAGTAPAAEVVRIDSDRQCVALNGGDTQPVESIVLGRDHALQHVFVYIKSGLEGRSFPVPNDPVVVDQQACRYLPRVVGVRVGQPVEVRNGDPLLHNVRSASAINQPFNQGQPVQGMVFRHTFTTREVMVPLSCDVHAWMNAYIGAVEHPFFAVTAEAGTFTLGGVPPGTYTLEAWHEQLGTEEQTVTVGAGESANVEFTFTR